MSLILEALKKLEREKRSSEPGFLVLGPTSWPSAAPGGRWAFLVLVAGLPLLAAAVLGLLGWRSAGPAPASSRAAIEPSPAAFTRPSPISTPRPALASTTVRGPSAAVAQKPERNEMERAGSAPQAVLVSEPEIHAISEPAAPPSEAQRPRFRLQAISLRDGKPVAVLNDRLVYEGESFDGVSVVRIGDAEIELQVDGQRVVVSF